MVEGEDISLYLKFKWNPVVHPHTLAHQMNNHKPQTFDAVQIFNQYQSRAYALYLLLIHSLLGMLFGFVFLMLLLKTLNPSLSLHPGLVHCNLKKGL